jgi:hypothetical protein
MSKIKNFIEELAEKLGKDFMEVTNEDIQNELKEKEKK